MALYRDKAVVLRTYKLKEIDRIVVFMTEHHGKVRAVAKGVRKSGSRFGGRLEPMNHVDVLFSEGRDLDIVSQVDLVSTAGAARNDLDRIARGMSMVEVVDQLGMEREATPHLYKMLVGGLATLEKTDSEIVVAAFFLKLLAAEGSRPELDTCVSCRKPLSDLTEGTFHFNVESGGVQCRECILGRRISSDAIALMRQILGGQLVDALNHESGPALREVSELATQIMEHHTERRLRTMHTNVH